MQNTHMHSRPLTVLRARCCGLPTDVYTWMAMLNENVWCGEILEWLGETSAHTDKHSKAWRRSEGRAPGNVKRPTLRSLQFKTFHISFFFTFLVNELDIYKLHYYTLHKHHT